MLVGTIILVVVLALSLSVALFRPFKNLNYEIYKKVSNNRIRLLLGFILFAGIPVAALITIIVLIIKYNQGGQ